MRFLVFLGLGLGGLCLFLKTLLDALFIDWDVIADVRGILENPSRLRKAFQRTEDTALAERLRLGTRM